MPRILSGESDYVKIFSRGIARGFGGLREYTAYNYLTTLIHYIILIKLIMATSKKKLKVSHKGDEGSVFSFVNRLTDQLRSAGKIRTCETYQAALNSFMRFREWKDLLVAEIDQDVIIAYEIWLKDNKVSMNTISFYMRIMRAIYNRAVDRGLAQQGYPFKQVYTGNEQTVKRAVSLSVIKQLKSLRLERDSPQDYARDMFLFSFYTRGMSFIDMAFLKKTDLSDGVLSYRRRKTKQLLFIRWEPCMQDIVNRYSKKDSPYLLSIIRKPGDEERKQFISEEHRVIRNLKALGKSLGLSTPLTMYVARHTWASIARSENIPLSVISESLGHNSEKTTQIYLSALDMTLVDNANRLILSLL